MNKQHQYCEIMAGSKPNIALPPLKKKSNINLSPSMPTEDYETIKSRKLKKAIFTKKIPNIVICSEDAIKDINIRT